MSGRSRGTYCSPFRAVPCLRSPDCRSLPHDVGSRSPHAATDSLPYWRSPDQGPHLRRALGQALRRRVQGPDCQLSSRHPGRDPDQGCDDIRLGDRGGTLSTHAGCLEELRGELGKYDWSVLRSYLGRSSQLPSAIEALIFAESDQDARAAYWRIDNVAIVQGRLSESAYAVTSCLLIGLPFAKAASRDNVFDLLATIAGGYDRHIDIESVGPVSARECVRLMSRCLSTFTEEVQRGNPSCVDIALMCAIYMPPLRVRVAEVFEEALDNPTCASIVDLIENSLVDLRGEV